MQPTVDAPSARVTRDLNGKAGIPSAARVDSAQPPRSPSRTKRTVWLVVGALVVLLLLMGSFFGYRFLDNTLNYVSTDNARVTSQNVSIGSTNAGRVASLSVDVGAQVRQGDLLAQIEVPGAVRSLQNGTPDLEFVAASDQRTDVRSPMDGIVVAVPAAVHQSVSQGQPLVVLMDPMQVFISANIDENEIARVHVGQEVRTYVVAADKTVDGRVLAITPATAASFLATPPTNATGDYTNPGQLVPVKISVADTSTILFAGATAQVKIRVT